MQSLILLDTSPPFWCEKSFTQFFTHLMGSHLRGHFYQGGSRLRGQQGFLIQPFFPRWLAGWLTGWLANWLAGWLIDWLAGRLLAGWLAGCLADWLAGWLAG